MKKKPTKQQLEDLCSDMLSVIEAINDEGVHEMLKDTSLENERIGNLAISIPVMKKAKELGIISSDKK